MAKQPVISDDWLLVYQMIMLIVSPQSRKYTTVGPIFVLYGVVIITLTIVHIII